MANILVVDDDEITRISVESALTKDGHTVVTAIDGYEALETANSELFDLIVSDANMPGGISGFNLVATLRKIERYKDTPIIFLTGRREKKDVDRAIDSGADDYVIKPIDFDIFVGKIQSLLETKSVEYAFYECKVSLRAEWLVAFEILGISEQGITIKSPTQLVINKKIKIESDIYNKVGIEPSTLRVASCRPADRDNKTFTAQLNFIGLSEGELQKIRIWVNNVSKTRRIGAG